MELTRPTPSRAKMARPEPSAPAAELESAVPIHSAAINRTAVESEQSSFTPSKSVASQQFSSPISSLSISSNSVNQSQSIHRLTPSPISTIEANSTESPAVVASSSLSASAPPVALYYLNRRFPLVPFILHRVTPTSDLTDLSVFYSTSISLIRRYNRRAVFEYLDHMIGDELYVPVSPEFVKSTCHTIQVLTKTALDEETELRMKKLAAVKSFISRSNGASEPEATFYLDECDYEVDAAVNQYWDDIEWEQQRETNANPKAVIKRRPKPFTDSVHQPLLDSDERETIEPRSIQPAASSVAGLRKVAANRQQRLESLVKESESYWKQRKEDELAKKKQISLERWLNRDDADKSAMGEKNYVVDSVGAIPVVYLKPNTDGFYAVIPYEAVEMQPIKEAMNQPMAENNNAAADPAFSSIFSDCLPAGSDDRGSNQRNQATEAESRKIQQSILVSNSKLF